jgi:hypothetical protein
MSKLDLIIQVCEKCDDLSPSDISAMTATDRWFAERKLKLLEQVRECAPLLCHTHIKDSKLNNGNQYDYFPAYINRFMSTLLGVGTENLLSLSAPLESENSVYSGLYYFIIRASDQVSVFNKHLVEEVIDAFVKVDQECDVESLIHYNVDNKSRLVVRCGELWALIAPMAANAHEGAFTNEKNMLKKLERDFIAVAPQHFWNRSFDFTLLNDQQFERLCRDLLLAMNFKNIRVRGKSHAADGGVDITAEEEYQTLIGTETRVWIFQCKHTKQQVSRKDISEVRDLLCEFHANCYGLFYTGFFTPGTLDRIKKVSESDQIMIKGWDHNDLEVELAKHPALAAKYFGV